MRRPGRYRPRLQPSRPYRRSWPAARCTSRGAAAGRLHQEGGAGTHLTAERETLYQAEPDGKYGRQHADGRVRGNQGQTHDADADQGERGEHGRLSADAIAEAAQYDGPEGRVKNPAPKVASEASKLAPGVSEGKNVRPI